MIEEFRAVWADRFVLSLINKRMINGKQFKQKENGAVLMDDNCQTICISFHIAEYRMRYPFKGGK